MGNMWKARPEDNRLPLSGSPTSQPAPANGGMAASNPTPRESSKFSPEPQRGDVGHIGKSVVIRGELSGSEDLYLDGEIEGTVNLRDHKLVIGPNGKIKATITAREIVVHGKVEGNIGGCERVELKRSSALTGDISTHRIVIEDGAMFKGGVEIKESRENKSETRKPVNGVGLNTGSSVNAPISANAAVGQGSFLESK